MDMRTGELYKTVKEARAAGVPDEYLVEIERLQKAREDASQRSLKATMRRRGKDVGDFVRVTKGPFKGRVYERLHGQVIRRRDLEDQKKK